MAEKFQKKGMSPHDGTVSDHKVDLRELRRAGLAVEESGTVTGEDVRALRQTFGISQAVLANYLGTSTAAVTQWELGLRTPTGATATLLSLIKRKGLAVLL